MLLNKDKIMLHYKKKSLTFALYTSDDFWKLDVSQQTCMWQYV